MIPQPFLQAVLAAPDDDGPRLVLADHLDELNTPEAAARAAFIRACIARGDDNAQGEFVRLCETVSVRTEPELFGLPAGWAVTCYRRLHETRTEIMREGRGPVASALTRRGFVSALTLTAADWLLHADALTAATPLERVTLTTWPETYRDQGDPGRFILGVPPTFGAFLLTVQPAAYREGVAAALADRWGPKPGRPGIAFTLPEPEARR